MLSDSASPFSHPQRVARAMEPDPQKPDTPSVLRDPEPERKSDFGDVLLGLGFILFAILMFVGALNFPYRARMGFFTSSAFTPILLCGLVVILSVILIVVTYRKNPKMAPRAWFAAVAKSDLARRALVIIGITATFILGLVGTIDFFVANCLFFLAIFWFLKIGTPVRIIVYAVANAAVVAFVIPYIFQLPLP